MYFTENELLPGRCAGTTTSSSSICAVTTARTPGPGGGHEPGMEGPEKYIATVPQIFDLWADPQERYDLFMNNFTERTWLAPIMGDELKKVAESFLKYPPRKLQSEGYTGPITISGFERFESIRKQLEQYKINLNPVP